MKGVPEGTLEVTNDDQKDPIGPETIKELTVSQAVDFLGFGWFQVFLIIVCGLVSMVECCETMLLSFFLPNIAEKWELSSFEESLIGTFVFLGAMVGVLVWGIIADKFGRKVVVVCIIVSLLFFGVFSAFSWDYYSLIITRFCCGVGIGGATIPFALLLEFLPRKRSGFFMLIVGSFWSFGSAYEALLAWLLLGNVIEVEKYGLGDSWRWYLGMSSLPLFVVLPILPFIPESLRFDSIKGNEKNARRTLKMIERMNCKKLPEEVPLKFIKQKKKAGRLRDLLAKDVFWVFLNVIFLNVENSLLYFGICFYTPHFFEDIGGVFVGSFFANCAEWLGLVYCLIFVLYVSRKTLISFVLFNTGIGLFLLLLPVDSFFVKVIFAIFVRMNISGGIVSSTIMFEESLPTNIRASGIGISGFAAKIADLFAPFISEMPDFNGVSLPLIIYGCVAVLNGVQTLFHPIETKDRELDDIGMKKELRHPKQKVKRAPNIILSEPNSNQRAAIEVEISNFPSKSTNSIERDG